jgi:hypothetical protein
LARLEPRLGHNKALVAIARKLLVVVWRVLTEESVDRHAEPYQVARALMVYGYRLRRTHRPHGQSVPAFVRAQLDRLGIGAELATVAKGPSTVLHLPPPQTERQTGAAVEHYPTQAPAASR